MQHFVTLISHAKQHVHARHAAPSDAHRFRLMLDMVIKMINYIIRNI